MIFVILLSIAAFLYYVDFKRRFGYWERRGVKGPTASILTGTLFSGNRGDAREVEKRYLKKYGPVFGTYTGGQRVFNTSVPEHIKQVLGDLKTFQNFGLFFVDDKRMHRSLLFMNGARWKEHRSSISHHFTSRKLKNFLSHSKTVVDNFIANIESQRGLQNGQTDVFEIRKMCRCYTVDMIVKSMFAIDIDTFKQDQQNSKFANLALRFGDVNLVHIFWLEFVWPFVRRLLKLNAFDVEPLDKLGDLYKRMLEERDPKARYHDLCELLQDQIKAGKLTSMSDDDVIANGMLGQFAGTDTSSNALTKMFYFLATEREARERLQTELRRTFKDGITYEALMEHRYLDAFVSECLRLGPPLLSIDRVVTKDVQLGEYKLEKGVVVNLVFWINHISERFFPNPEKFDPSRFLDKSSSNPNQANRNDVYLPFSAGNRQCVGKQFVNLEAKYLIARILLEYDLFKPDDLRLVEVSRRRFVNPHQLYVGLRKRVPQGA